MCSQYLCSSGRYGAVLGETSANCTGTCLPGFECPEGSTTATAVICPPGYYCSGGPKLPCPAGRYSAANGTATLADCRLCDAGTFNPVVAAASASQCSRCTNGEGSDAGAVECWPVVVFANASNPLPTASRFATGAVVTIAFSKSTNAPADALTFVPGIGVTTQTWLNRSAVVVVTVVDGTGTVVDCVAAAHPSALLVVADVGDDGAIRRSRLPWV